MSLTPPVRVSLIGLGALGILHANDFLQHPELCTLTCIADKERQKRYAEEGIFCNGTRIEPVMLAPDADPPAPADLILVCVKATALDQAIRDMSRHVGEDTVIISLLNGITSEDELRRAFPGAKVIHCAVHVDALRVNHRLACSHHGTLVFGTDRPELEQTLHDLIAFLEQVGIHCREDKDVLHAMYNKWMLNCGINQTVTVFKGTYAILQREGRPRDVCMAAMREAMEVARAEGVNLTEEDFERHVRAISDYVNPQSMPSMRQDSLAGRPMEISLFSGAVLALGTRHGIETPVNAWLHEELTRMDTKKS